MKLKGIWAVTCSMSHLQGLQKIAYYLLSDEGVSEVPTVNR
jgi:hypothetical protein